MTEPRLTTLFAAYVAALSAAVLAMGVATIVDIWRRSVALPCDDEGSELDMEAIHAAEQRGAMLIRTQRGGCS